ncbi:MAG: DUF3179 domain-containing (seleno)protein [Pirellulaceae bacterium]|nr:DUF3179 domain-containing (seleno)protein [Pirellulaceae bacterium]
MSRQSITLLVAIVLIVLGIVFASDYLVFRRTRPDYSDPVIYSEKNKQDASAGTNGISETPAWMVPQAAPEMVPVSEVKLADKEKVIAIEVGGQHFAYPLFYLYGIGEHIVNDSITGKPITVIYCSQTGCTRVLTTDKTDRPLPVIQQGLVNSELALFFAGEVHQLSKDTIPLDQYPHEVVSWPVWREQHPDGLVYPGVTWDDEEEDPAASENEKR